MQFVIFLHVTVTHNLKIIHIFINTQQNFMFHLSILIAFCEKYDQTNSLLIKAEL